MWKVAYIYFISSEMKKIQNKIDQESDEIKKKEYYSSSEYKMMEKKKKKIGLARMKTKTVSFISILPQTFTIWSFFITVLESFFKDIFRQQIKVGWLKLSGHQKFDFGSFSNWESKLLWKWFSSTFTTFFKNNNLNRYVFTIKANINGFSVHPSVHLRGGLTQKPLKFKPNWTNFKSGFAAWHVPDKYVCSYGAEKDNYACSQNDNIPCWVSRPMEKEVMMWYMLTMSLVSTALGIC